jgi:hypothetical protein
MGMPPLTGFDPSRAAFEERNRLSIGSGSTLPGFQEITVAPYNRISTLDP